MARDDERSGERRGEERRYGRTRSRSRSRSPRRHRDETRRRSPLGEGDSRRERRMRSPHGDGSRDDPDDRDSRHRHRHHHHHHRGHRDSPRDTTGATKSSGKEKKAAASVAATLPYEARQLGKSEMEVFRPLLAYYLDLQKQKDICEMDDREVRGRWKSFVGKWNRGELSQGWYDPEMFVSAKERAVEVGIDRPRSRGSDGSGREVVERRGEERNYGGGRTDEEEEEEDHNDGDKDDDDDEDLGPRLPPTARTGHQRPGPGIPNMADLSLQRESLAEEAQRDREARASDLRQARKEDRKLQRERLDEVAPRAEAGTRERQLEKRAAVNEKMKEFRDKGGDGGGVAEVGEQELMGGGDSFAELKAMKAREERKKTEREVRREEIARARAAEREERVREYREREEGVMKGLRELAKQRFG
ncbi:hypothetical protein CORC01_04405 [Colletotrichum orchidophilum]|uniref:RNA helicase HEL117 n=1 Tax=Colletotrichum orchidophilum TaxID=1209926 RepID=A0A1G4BFT6_9PEZI|nr:uncharacterized protein CORC01_04405 [Colletotrichum orchidophilum]OHF00216.1 hypothetical protein CORC01_04405 [Colletotrichum orchidophilum]